MKVKFFITPVYPYGNDHYYHEIIAVAEGFKALGYTIIGNANYWFQPELNEYLIRYDESTDYTLCIYDYRYVTSFAHLLFRKGYPNFDRDKKHVMVDRNDWIIPVWNNNPDYNIFDLIFAGNIYDNMHYAPNIRPWAIGLTDRIMNTIDLFYDEHAQRNNVTGYNFRVDHNMRDYLMYDLQKNLKTFPTAERFTKPEFDSEADRIYYKCSTQRHNPAYYKMLCRSRFFLTFGGYYDFKPLKYQPYNFFDKVMRKPFYWNYKRLKKSGKDFSDMVFIFQQDNFRFWEVLYSGAIAINLDFDYWHFKLPAMPADGEHYIAIQKLRNNNVEDKMKHLGDADLKRISQNGRRWVKEHYSPKAQAERILKELNGKL